MPGKQLRNDNEDGSRTRGCTCCAALRGLGFGGPRALGLRIYGFRVKGFGFRGLGSRGLRFRA